MTIEQCGHCKGLGRAPMRCEPCDGLGRIHRIGFETAYACPDCSNYRCYVCGGDGLAPLPRPAAHGILAVVPKTE